MKTVLELPSGPLTLYRYPQRRHETLQAWDSADEYLLEAYDQLDLPSNETIVVANDQFGALACALTHRGHALCLCSDSYIAELATRHNLSENQLSQERCQFVDPLSNLSSSPLTLLKVPKNLSLLELQLAQIQRALPEGALVIAAGKTQEIHTSTLTLFEKYLGATHTSLAKKKSRLIYSKIEKKSASPLPEPCQWPLENTPYTLTNHANVFSRTRLDIGARFFMAHLPKHCDGSIIDLGCGNGVLGLVALEKNPEATLFFVDESRMSLLSAQANIAHNRPQDMARCTFNLTNCLEGFAPDQAQIILCNPPFHQQHAITDHIARQMFRDAKRVLQRQGELWVVANRHLNYEYQLTKMYGNCRKIAQNNKFVILRTIH